jgi:hypothetical protein
MTMFECEECEHQWSGTQSEFGGHDWETCPACGADDGENCWDCGESMEDKMGGVKCTACQHTLCDDCTGLHRYGREVDKGHCGATARVL